MTVTTTSTSFHHGGISRFNAWFFTAFAGYINHIAKRQKRQAFEGLDSSGTVVEIGAGTGANFAYLQPGTRLHCVEPSLAMHERLRARAAQRGIDLGLQAGSAAHIDLPDSSVDEVICSLVLCTVDDPAEVLAEVRRVLRPGGRFRFVEHVAAEGPIRGRVQRLIRPVWGWIFEGCDPHRTTALEIRSAGFASVQLGPASKLRHSIFWPVNTVIAGTATR